jgi:branched-chain amino acid transport system ATP-binding protein
LAERRTQLAGTMSGGEQQILAIGMGLMAEPKVLMLDEPSLGLAPIYVENVFEEIRALKEAGTTILLVEQLAKVALAVADRGVVLQYGEVVAEGTSAELMANARVVEAYLGSD